MATLPGLDRTTPIRPQRTSNLAEYDVLKLGAAGDLSAAQAVARDLLQVDGPSAAPAERVLRTLVLTAACLHAAQTARDDVELADVVVVLRSLQSDGAPPAELSESPLPFVRYVDAELRTLEAADARDLVGQVLASLQGTGASIRPLAE